MFNRYGDTEECLLHMQRIAGSILSQGQMVFSRVFPWDFIFGGTSPMTLILRDIWSRAGTSTQGLGRVDQLPGYKFTTRYRML